MKRKIDMEKRRKEFRGKNGKANPFAGVILSKQLYKVKCKECGKVFECAKGSLAYQKELCVDCGWET